MSRAADAAAVAAVLRERAARSELWLRVHGPSMLPTLEPAVEVLVRPARRPRLGEIWAVVGTDTAVVVHRCVWLHPGGPWTFRGDAEVEDDRPVSAARLVGRVELCRAERAVSPVRRSRTRVFVTLPRRVVRGLGRRLGPAGEPGRSDR